MSAPTEQFEDIGARALPVRLMTGIQFAFGGISFTFAHGKLIKLAIIPIFINILLFGVFVVGGITQIDDVVAWASFGIPEESFWSWVETLWAGVVWLATLVAVLLGGFVATVVVGNILAGPIYDLLSERVEVIVLGRSAAEPFSMAGFVADLFQETVLLILRLALYLAGLLIIFAIGLIPLLGQVLAPILSAGWSWLFLCLELHNATLARHKVKGGRRIGHIFGYQAGHLGFGAAAWVLMWVPVMMPFLVVGATRHHLALATWDRAPSKLSDADKALLRAQPAALAAA